MTSLQNSEISVGQTGQTVTAPPLQLTPLAEGETGRVLLIKCSMIRDQDARDWPKAPPLGVLSISSALKARCRHPIETRVMNVEFLGRPGEAEGELQRTLREFQPHVVGLSAVTCEASNAARIAALVKDLRPGVPVIVGGPHPTSYPDVVADANIDVAVLGEGEETAIELVDRILAGQGDFSDVAGIAYRGADGKTRRTPGRVRVGSLDDLPFPDWEAIDLNVYHEADNYVGFRTPGWKYMTICTSRGCPYRCIYCHDIFGKRAYYRSPESVLREMEALHRRFDIREFSIIDDIFNLDGERMMRILDGLIDGWTDAEGLFHPPLDPGRIRLTFPNGLRGDIMTPAQIERLRQAGTYFAAFAVEAGSERVRKLMRKNLDLPRTLENIRYASDLGIITCVFFMIGFPSETAEEMEETLDVARDMGIDLPNIFVTIPQYGTELHSLAKEMGFIPEGFGFDQFQYGLSEMNCSAVDDEGFRAIRRRAAAVIEDPRRRERLKRKMSQWGLEFAETKSATVGVNPSSKARYQQILAEQARKRGAGNTVVDDPRVPAPRPTTTVPLRNADFPGAERIIEGLRRLADRGEFKPGWRLWTVSTQPGAVEAVFSPLKPGMDAPPDPVALTLTPRDDGAPALMRSTMFNFTVRRLVRASARISPEEEATVAFLVSFVRRLEASVALTGAVPETLQHTGGGSVGTASGPEALPTPIAA